MYCGEHNGRETGGEQEGDGRKTGGRREEDGREKIGHEGNGWEESAGRSSLGLPKTDAWRGCCFVSKSGSPTPPRNG